MYVVSALSSQASYRAFSFSRSPVRTDDRRRGMKRSNEIDEGLDVGCCYKTRGRVWLSAVGSAGREDLVVFRILILILIVAWVDPRSETFRAFFFPSADSGG